VSHELFDRDSNIAHIREECGRITLNEGDEAMAGLMSAEEIFEKTQAAAVAATSPDEKALQIDYGALKDQIRTALGDRKVALCHINKFLPEGYEEQGRFNVLVLTAGNVFFDMVIGDSYFRYDVVSVGQLDKVQVIDAMWDNKEKRREEPFLSLRLMHGEEAHLLLALDNEERASLLAFARAVAAARNPER
jgi:hypothetical protein